MLAFSRYKGIIYHSGLVNELALNCLRQYSLCTRPDQFACMSWAIASPCISLDHQNTDMTNYASLPRHFSVTTSYN